MTHESWQRMKELFAEALERPPAERSEFIEKACAGDNALQAELESLLAEEHAAGGFLSSPAIPNNPTQTMGPASWNVSQPAERALPAVIGHYRILDFIGEGGMAVVYKAEQEQPRRIVALKVIKPGLAGPEYERRFEREKDALARLQHEGIARIYDAGTGDSASGPQHYFAMEFIEQGQPLTAYAESKRLNARQRLELVAQVCEAVHYAHQRFIIHRDLKPSNILVDEHGHPKVLDFGVARMTDSDIGRTRQTEIGQIVGTFEYMSPEQALGDPGELDTRSDVYALGVILYELMVGERPYDLRNKPDLAAVHTILNEDPARLGSINRQYRGDIETIAAKCLEKEKGRRYSSAAELAADIRRHLNNEPIAAHAASMNYQLQKFARRNKALVATAAGVFIALVIGLIISNVFRVRARRLEVIAENQTAAAVAANNEADHQRRIAEDARREAQIKEKEALDYLAESIKQTSRADGAAKQREIAEVQKRQAELAKEMAEADKRKQAADDAIELQEEKKQTEIATQQAQKAATAQAEALAETARQAQEEKKQTEIATQQVQKAVATAKAEAEKQKAETAIGDLVAVGRVEQALQKVARALALDPSLSTAQSWAFDLLLRGDIGASGGSANLARSEADPFAHPPLRHTNPVLSAAFDPSGSDVATTATDKIVRFWNWQTGMLEFTLQGHTQMVNSVTFSPDGTRILSASNDGTAIVWSVPGRYKVSTVQFAPAGRPGPGPFGIKGVVLAMSRRSNGAAFSLDGRKIVTWSGRVPIGYRELSAAAGPGIVDIWNAATGMHVGGPLVHPKPVNFAAFNSDGSTVVTACDDGVARVWNLSGGTPLELRHGKGVASAVFSPVAPRVLTESGDGTARIWDANTGAPLATFQTSGPVYLAAFSPDGRRVATASHDGARIWDVESGYAISSPLRQAGALTSIAFSSDGRRVVTTSIDKTAQVWEVSYDFGASLPDAIKLLEGLGGYDASSDKPLSEQGRRSRIEQVRMKAMAQSPGPNNFIRWFFEHRYN